jgi:hypothetical protein
LAMKKSVAIMEPVHGRFWTNLCDAHRAPLQKMQPAARECEYRNQD